ncbi:hypothetical protein [Megamonas funiformis]|uniref:hypothetical protein n=1 Tax=Megamonas funiformis TaxID=437897 RepID=UPI00195A6143|nr:hypothetical protein [Megamonas funiformis]MBM6725694.1 hypothetical protein [Megamonas funiformis]
MNNLWILTEEKPKLSVIYQIIKLYEKNFHKEIIFTNKLEIKPSFNNMNQFKFEYIVKGINIQNIDKIIIKIVSGNSSFLDFLIFEQANEPSNNLLNVPLMGIEETKTNDDESRNTSVYQRATKFVFIDAYYKNIKLYMLYNDELEARFDKKPSDTNIFGTNLILTLGVNIVGKNINQWFHNFNSIDEIIMFKNNMRKPPIGNVPITIIKSEENNTIFISARLSKPANKGNIAHDPNIGALSLIAKCLRYLGWNGKIIITNHGVTQEYINAHYTKNKFIYICQLLNIELENISLPNYIPLPINYWHYEMNSEKIASILLHIVGEYYGMREIYQNHAGCERGYFKDKYNNLITLPKKDIFNNNLYIPDLILHDVYTKHIFIIEGKKLSTLRIGLNELNNYDSIENYYIKRLYPDCQIHRYLSIFGGTNSALPHEKVLLYVNNYGDIFINPTAPSCIQEAFSSVMK